MLRWNYIEMDKPCFINSYNDSSQGSKFVKIIYDFVLHLSNMWIFVYNYTKVSWM